MNFNELVHNLIWAVQHQPVKAEEMVKSLIREKLGTGLDTQYKEFE
jgi:hypothetical protein